MAVNWFIELLVLYVWFIQICCYVSDSSMNSEVEEGPCMDESKMYALPRYNPVKVGDLWGTFFPILNLNIIVK